MYFADNTSIKEAAQSGILQEPETENLEYPRDDEGNMLDEDGNIINTDEGSGAEIEDTNALLETFIVDMLSNLDYKSRKAYMESGEFHGLYEAGVVKHRTSVRLSKDDDLERRIHAAALQRAREKGDADWEALRKNRVNERRLLNKIYSKYSMQVKRDAIQAQKRLIKITPNIFNTMRAIR